jgi:CheY-like chemotaxis protein
MSGEIISLRLLAVFGSEQDGELMRQGATIAAIPGDFTHVTATAAARNRLAEGNVDIVFLDSTIAEPDRQEFIAAARAARHSPSVILVAPTSRDAADLAAAGAKADGIVVKPAKVPDAKALIESCSRLKVPSRALVVDDSSTMRNIVRKILASCRFPLDIAEAQEGLDALKQIAAGKFDFVFLDCNMPGLNGFEMLAELKRQFPRLGVFMMSSAQDQALAERARAAGAAAFLKKPFYPADIDTLLYAFHRLRPPRRPGN